MIAESSHAGGPDRGPYVAQQSWRDLLFAHWPVAAKAVQDRLPAGLHLDLFNGTAWIGIVPFTMEGLRPRHLPGVPGATNFLELNVRTYVRVGDRPGVFFFSLDASSALAVAGARALFDLPYHQAEMTCERQGDEWIRYTSHRQGQAAAFVARYRPIGFGEPAAPGSLEEFLVERYRLFTVEQGQVRRIEIDHAPWKLRGAEAEITLNTMAAAAGLALPDQPPMVHFVDRQDVLTGTPIDATRAA